MSKGIIFYRDNLHNIVELAKLFNIELYNSIKIDYYDWKKDILNYIEDNYLIISTNNLDIYLFDYDFLENNITLKKLIKKKYNICCYNYLDLYFSNNYEELLKEIYKDQNYKKSLKYRIIPLLPLFFDLQLTNDFENINLNNKTYYTLPKVYNINNILCSYEILPNFLFDDNYDLDLLDYKTSFDNKNLFKYKHKLIIYIDQFSLTLLKEPKNIITIKNYINRYIRYYNITPNDIVFLYKIDRPLKEINLFNNIFGKFKAYKHHKNINAYLNILYEDTKNYKQLKIAVNKDDSKNLIFIKENAYIVDNILINDKYIMNIIVKNEDVSLYLELVELDNKELL